MNPYGYLAIRCKTFVGGERTVKTVKVLPYTVHCYLVHGSHHNLCFYIMVTIYYLICRSTLPRRSIRSVNLVGA